MRYYMLRGSANTIHDISIKGRQVGDAQEAFSNTAISVS